MNNNDHILNAVNKESVKEGQSNIHVLNCFNNVVAICRSNDIFLEFIFLDLNKSESETLVVTRKLLNYLVNDERSLLSTQVTYDSKTTNLFKIEKLIMFVPRNGKFYSVDITEVNSFLNKLEKTYPQQEDQSENVPF
ncbi:MAG: hypothetical protein QXE78_02130 [Nitrososphaeria archaeon]